MQRSSIVTKMYDIDKVFEILRAILSERCSRGESVRDLHSRDLAYATPRMPDMVVFPQSEEEVCQIPTVRGFL